MKIHELIETLQQYNQEWEVDVLYETCAHAPITEVTATEMVYNGRLQMVVHIVTRD